MLVHGFGEQRMYMVGLGQPAACVDHGPDQWSERHTVADDRLR